MYGIIYKQSGNDTQNKTKYALVAQLDRVFGYEPKGQGFESLQACQKKTSVSGVFFAVCRFLPLAIFTICCIIFLNIILNIKRQE